jgi:mannose-6-phosphate isomerase-like protein (cupin superfamily)
MNPYFLPAGESVRPAGPFRMLIDGGISDGRLTVYEGIIPTGGPPMHIHDFDEMLLVIEGRLLVQLGSERWEAGPGDFAWMAAGHQHAFANPGPEPVRAIGMGIPSGIENLFADRAGYLSGLGAGEAPDPAMMVGPPLAF